MSLPEDEDIIVLRLSRADAKIIKHVIAREKAWNYFEALVKSWWIWTAAGGVLAVWALWDKIKVA